MSSTQQSSWSTPIMIVLIGGLAFYGMTRGPSCPANTNRSSSSNEVVITSPNTDGQPTLLHADESNFDEVVLQASGPVLVDFYADWCGPCQSLAPVLERVAADLPQGRIVKVNTDHSPGLVARYNIEALPTLLVFNDGREVERTMGFQDEQGLRRLLQQ